MIHTTRSASVNVRKDSKNRQSINRTASRYLLFRLHRYSRAVRHNLSRALCLCLIMAMLSASTPAAAQTIVGTASEWSVGLFFWLESSGVASRVRALATGSRIPSASSQENQQERNAQAVRIQVYPGDVTVRAGETILFAAVAYDAGDTPVGGVQFDWSARDVGRNRPAHVSKRGDFTAKNAGTFKVTAEGAGQQAQVTVTVLEGEKKNDKAEKPAKVREVSTRDLPSQAAAQPLKGDDEQSSAHGTLSRLARAAKSLLFGPAAAPAAPIACDDCGWGDDNYTSADDPGNTVGDPPGGVQDDGAGSGNFQLSAPVLNLPGRGLDIALNLTYNSRLWNKSGSQITYDIDRGWPAPGWSLGFGKMLGMGVYNGGMLVDADGTRHPYAGTVTIPADMSYTNFVGHTADATFIDYSYHSGLGGALVYGQAKYPNGTVIDYYTQGTGALYPSRVTDAQGNFLTITYVNNAGPNIQTITDSLGRVIQFYYDTNGLLTAITTPGVTANTTRTLVRLHYKRLTLSYGFAATMTPQVRDAMPWVVDAIYYPGTDTGYWFGDADSYSSYGMITKVREQRGMTLTAASLTEQGTVTKGTETSESAYNYPMTANSTLTDAPSYTTRTDTWDGMDTTAAVTSYLVQQNTNPRKITITLPNGTKSIQYSYNAPGQFNDGLLYQDETYGPGDTVPQQKSTVAWEAGAYDSARPSRTETTDELDQKTAAEFDYGAMYNQVTEVRDYDFGGLNLLRVRRTQYENSTAYTNRHIFNLVQQTEIFAGNGTTRESRTEYVYDGATMEDTPNVVQHLDSYNPYAPTEEFCDYQPKPGNPDIEIWVCTTYNPYNPATAYRGNVTQVKTYTDAATLASPVIQTHAYDITGNLVTSTAACCEQTSYDYTSATQYAYPTVQTRGSIDPAPTVRVTTKTSYSFNTGLPLTTTDTNNLTTQTVYFPDTLRAQKVTLPTGAFTSYAYDDDAMTVTETTYLAGGTIIAEKNVKHLNGLGLVKREEALTRENNLDYWDVVDTQYDKLGRVWKTTFPYRSGEAAQWTESFYDELGRVIKIKAPDGSEVKSFYNEATRPTTASTTSGQTTRMVNAWGREHWERTDAQGRLVEVVEPDPLGNGLVMGTGASAASLVTKYSYDTLGNLTLVVQGSQQRKFDYDSLNRLTRQKLAEQSATLDDAGVYAGVGTGGKWSDVFSYDTRSNLISATDARGVKTLFTYSNDPLNRLQSITYNIAGVGAAEQAVAAAPKITYTYMTTGDLTRVDTVTTTGVSTENLDYDTAGRVSSQTLTLTSRASYPMVTDYVYDSLSRVKDVRYPAQYGVLNTPRKLVHQDYDVASRVSAVKVDGASYATGVTYNAASQATSLKIGAANANQLTESYDYDEQTGLLTGQTVVRGAGTTTPAKLLDLSYSYLRAGTTTGRTGQLTKITNNLDTSGKKNRAYEYDALGRLSKASGGASTTAPQWSEAYVYDRYGNRTTVTQAGTAADGSAIPRDGLTGLACSAATNRITGFTYDSAGNLTRGKRADGTWQKYEYDAASRLVKVKDDAGVTLAAYKYGATNQRLIAYDGDVTSASKTYYVCSGNKVIAEYGEDAAQPTTPQWTKNSVYLGDRMLATLEPNGSGGQFVQYYHPDRLGTRLISNASNTNVQEQVTLPYGTALDAESTGAVNRRFTSYDRNQTTQLDYAVNRHYDSGQGRFTQVDPLGMEAVNLSDPQSLNMYAYVGNDPVNRVDPEGLFWGKLWRAFKKIFKWLAVAAAVAVAVLTIIYAPVLFATTFKAVLGIISAVAAAAQSVLGAFGLSKAAAIFGIIGAAASFGTSLAALYAPVTQKGGMTWKNIFKAIAAGASLASKTLSEFGHKKIAQVLDLVSSATSFISDNLKDIEDKTTHVVTRKFAPSAWAIYKFARGTAERIANLAGATTVAGYLNVLGLAQDAYSLYKAFRRFEGKYNAANTSQTRRLDKVKLLQEIIDGINTAFGRINTAVQLAH
jgi:RHS repeat-associated protein